MDLDAWYHEIKRIRGNGDVPMVHSVNTPSSLASSVVPLASFFDFRLTGNLCLLVGVFRSSLDAQGTWRTIERSPMLTLLPGRVSVEQIMY
jgi:hypothetical protein